MRQLEQLTGIPLSMSPDATVPAFGGGGEGGGSALSWWFVECHGIWHNLALILLSALFVAYLSSQARKSYAKLTYGRSYIMIAYYALLWAVSLLNLLWCVLQAWQCTPSKEFSWNMLSLFSKSGMLFLEISIMAFLLQGNHAGGLEALTRTFVVSGVIVAADILLKAIYVFGFGVPLFLDANESANRVKWGLWIVHKLLLTAVYGFILFMHHSKWRERLPAKPAFYKYICVMFVLNAVSLFACILVGNGAGFGSWLYNLTTVCYHALYLPFLYVTFLADFFQEEDFRLENVYYSEMKDAGFFDADWDY
ncbi:transmembrane protein adipocyte-associated 1 homolog [Ananas comosus]|uniref:Transmembrane protein adipocyte-associated n=1 Tax=Ananas comosus TaxID=4615 RepID=A0A199V043_ANACO|nr:transmembrane protein adipocyte-associated 1 homolog [Ananas comosus]OAY70260.1 Transmembrane protein adipocyte-associated [Ananas comosus]